jgi:hypothetical protein
MMDDISVQKCGKPVKIWIQERQRMNFNVEKSSIHQSYVLSEMGLGNVEF